MGTLVDALVERLGPALQLNSPVERIERETNGWRVGSHRARAVLIAAPAAVAARLLAPIDAEAARLCAATPYVSTASIALAWPRDAVPHPLDGTGFVVARRHSDVRITACTWVSQKWDERAPEGFVLMRAFIGGAHDPGAVDLEDEELVAVARRDLGAVLGVTAAPLLARVHRWRDAGAQHLLGQLARMDRLDARLAAHAGLRVAGSGFRAVGIPDCVADARRAAAAILG
jgi:oxygen-dependent protoporphyrinogen oxidase